MDTTLAVPSVDVRDRIPDQMIRTLARQIAEKFLPHQIILFESYAYGKPSPESDVDLLVVMETSLREIDQALQIRGQFNILFGLDLLVYTPEHLSQRLAWGDSFLKEITERGIVLLDRPSGEEPIPNSNTFNSREIDPLKRAVSRLWLAGGLEHGGPWFLVVVVYDDQSQIAQPRAKAGSGSPACPG